MITLALVGVGKWGKNYLHAAKSIPNCAIKYLFSRTQNTLQSLPNTYIKSSSISDLLNYPDLDGVIIATPATTHYELVKLFMKKGINILVEKPLTPNLLQTQKLIQLAKQTSSILMVGHTYLYNPAFKIVEELMPTVGEVKYMLFESGNYGPFRSDVSPLWDWGPHDISMILDLFAETPQSISAWSINPDSKASKNIISLKLEFPSTIVLVIIGNLFPTKRRLVTIVGSKKSIIYNELESPKIMIIDQKTNSRFLPLGVTAKSPLAIQLQTFVSAIKNNTRHETDSLQALEIAKILSAAEKSLRSAKRIVL